MKVLFINTSDSQGGAARAAMRIMHGVQREGIDAQIFVKWRSSQADDVIGLSRFVPHNVFYRIGDRIANKIKNKWQHHKWRAYKRTKQDAYMSDMRSTCIHGALQKLDYDILHLHWVNDRFLDVEALKKIRKPIVWTLHDSWPFTGICHVPHDCRNYEIHCGACPKLGSCEENDLANEVFERKRRAYKELNLHIVTPSKWLADCARRSALFRRFPITIIPNCIDTELYQPMDKLNARKQLGLEDEKKYLLFGAMHVLTDVNKGFSYLKEALSYVSGRDTELLVYGTNDDLKRYELPMTTHSLGYINNDKIMVLLYNAADVCIVPSLSENLSNTIMESLSSGTPVVGFDIGGNGEMIDHMKNGYLAKERDCEDMAKGIEWCLSNNKDKVLIKNARSKVMNNYTIDIVSKRYTNLYQSL